ncbi:hypothetical protein YC2023_005350 [Brassica napus]
MGDLLKPTQIFKSNIKVYPTFSQMQNQPKGVVKTRTKNFAMKDYSEMFPRWDGELEDEKADNIARESPGLDVETMKGEIVRWLTGLTSNMVEGLSRCENTLKTQSHMIEGLTTQVGAVEKMVGKKTTPKLVHLLMYLRQTNLMETKLRSKGDESKGDESKGDESKGEESRAEESRAEESKAAETAPKGMTTRAKARDTQATVVSTKTSPKPLDPKRGKKSVKKK